MLSLRRTPLYDTHILTGARMTRFGNWEMPLSYTGIAQEHETVRSAVGMFDVSHMGEVLITGDDALGLVQFLTLNDAAVLEDGQAQYSAIPTEAGTFLDDILVYRYGIGRFMLVVNAANTAKDIAWIRRQEWPDAVVSDVSDSTAMLAVQGPRAARTLAPLTPAELSTIPPFRFVETALSGIAGTLSRTGYTGEDGFEFYFAATSAPALWDEILDAGRAHGMLPVGLGARNTLRLEASLLLHGRDIDETTNPYEAGLKWMVHLDKGPFVGQETLRRLGSVPPSRRLVGFQMEGREIARDGYPVFVRGTKVGSVTSGAPSISIKRNIGLTYLPAAYAAVGTRFQVGIRGHLKDAEVVHTPFYKRRTQE